jgi:cytochrome b561
MKNNGEYHPFAKFLHWGVVVLVAIQFLSAWVMLNFRNASLETYVGVHMSFGVLVLPFAPLLLWMRFFRPVDKPEMHHPTWRERAAVVVHYLLYILLILLPLSGWAYASVLGWDVRLFGSIDLPPLFAGSSFGMLFGSMHVQFAILIAVIIAGHIAAALYHHVVRKDGILLRMAPHWVTPGRSDNN